jgi:hypothetical protein
MKKETKPQRRKRQFNEAIAAFHLALQNGGPELIHELASEAERGHLFFTILRRIEERDAARPDAPRRPDET